MIEGKSGRKERFKEWLRTRSLRPLVLGNSHMAVRLHSFFLSDEAFHLFDPEAILEREINPNVIVLFGPLSPKLEKRFKEIRSQAKPEEVIYVENLLNEEDSEKAAEKARSLGIDSVVLDEFVTMEKIKQALTKAANV